MLEFFKDLEYNNIIDLIKIGSDAMNTMQVTFDMPETIAKYVDFADKDYQFRVQELIMYSLIQEDKLSFGKAAELLGIGKIRLITDLGNVGLPYFDQSFDEVMEDANAARVFAEA